MVASNVVWIFGPLSPLWPKLRHVSALSPLQDVMGLVSSSSDFAAMKMAIFKSFLTTVTLVLLLALVQSNGVSARSYFMRKDELHARQLERAKRFTIGNLIKAQQTPNFQQDNASSSTSGIKNITFHNPLASRELKFHLQQSPVLIAMSRVLCRWWQDSIGRLGCWP